MDEKIETGGACLRDEDIVRLAYSMAVGPERFYDLFHALSARIDNEAGQAGVDPASDALVNDTLAQLEPHFENALSLMHTSASRREKPKHSVQAMEHDVRPGLLISSQGRVQYANAAAQDVLGIGAGDVISKVQIERRFVDAYHTALTTLAGAADNQLIEILSLEKADGSGAVRAGLRRVSGDNHEVLGQIMVLSTSWNDILAQRFRTTMKLTPIELEIVRAVVTGKPLRELAQQRGRAVGTVRLQAKTLLAKLSLNSQTELLSLYASFKELDAGLLSDQGADPETDLRLLRLPDGRMLEYELAGPVQGTPVLFLPALLGGAALTPAMRQSLFARNIRLIVAWRPGMAACDVNGPADFGAFARYSADLTVLLDALDVSTCSVIGHITSAMFACAFAHHAPQRVSHVICANGTVPSVTGKHVRLIDKAERLRFSLLRKTPRVGRLIVHALLAKVDAGFDEEFLTAFLTSDADHMTMQDPAIRETFRAAYLKTIAQGYDSFVQELTLAAHDWAPFVQDMSQPLTFLVGAENPVYTPDVVAAFATGNARISVQTVPSTAHLMLYQAFEAVLAAARAPSKDLKRNV